MPFFKKNKGDHLSHKIPHIELYLRCLQLGNIHREGLGRDIVEAVEEERGEDEMSTFKCLKMTLKRMKCIVFDSR